MQYQSFIWMSEATLQAPCCFFEPNYYSRKIKLLSPNSTNYSFPLFIGVNAKYQDPVSGGIVFILKREGKGKAQRKTQSLKGKVVSSWSLVKSINSAWNAALCFAKLVFLDVCSCSSGSSSQTVFFFQCWRFSLRSSFGCTIYSGTSGH